MNIIFLGPISCGKGTQSSFVAEKYNLVHVSVGELLRERRNIEDEIGLKIALLQKQGQLVDDDITLQVLEEKIKTCDDNQGILFDGYPRTLNQAEALTAFLPTIGKKIDAVVDLEISEDVVVERIVNRLSCPNCKKGYNKLYVPPKKEGICDDCNTPLIQREDDNEETIRSRLTIYHDRTQPLIDYYDNLGLIISINSNQTIEKVTKDIIVSLEGKWLL